MWLWQVLGQHPFLQLLPGYNPVCTKPGERAAVASAQSKAPSFSCSLATTLYALSQVNVWLWQVLGQHPFLQLLPGYNPVCTKPGERAAAASAQSKAPSFSCSLATTLYALSQVNVRLWQVLSQKPLPSVAPWLQPCMH